MKSGPDCEIYKMRDARRAVSIEHVRGGSSSHWRELPTLSRGPRSRVQENKKLSDVFAVPTAGGACCAARQAAPSTSGSRPAPFAALCGRRQ